MLAKYERVIHELATNGRSSMKALGRSMQPLIEPGSVLTFKRTNDYQVEDVVFSRVEGLIVAAHKITKVDGDRFLISSNKGQDNGWTKQIYGRVTEVNGEAFGREL